MTMLAIPEPRTAPRRLSLRFRVEAMTGLTFVAPATLLILAIIVARCFACSR